MHKCCKGRHQLCFIVFTRLHLSKSKKPVKHSKIVLQRNSILQHQDISPSLSIHKTSDYPSHERRPKANFYTKPIYYSNTIHKYRLHPKHKLQFSILGCPNYIVQIIYLAFYSYVRVCSFYGPAK